MGWQEVTQDQFAGSLRYPLFNMHRQKGMPSDAAATDIFPAGRRTVWTERWEWIAVTVETDTGVRYWLSDKIEVLTAAEADARFDNGLHNAARKILAENQAREIAAAKAAGLTVEAWKAKRETKALRKRLDRHRRTREQFERDMLSGRAFMGTQETRQPIQHLSNKDA